MPKIAIDDRTLATLRCPPGQKDMLLFDRTLRGFAVRVTRAGSCVLLYSYNLAGKTRRMPIGTWGEGLTASAARKEAITLAARVRLGGDPAGERRIRHDQVQRQQAQDRFTLAVLIDNWQAAMAHRRYADEAARRVRRAFAPWLDRPAAALSKREAIQAVDRLASESGIIAARRAAAYGRTMFAWAVKRDAVGTNPFAGIALPGREVARDRVLEAAELGAIWRAAGSLDPVRGGFVRLLLLTLQRRGEVAGLRRTELAPDLSTWTLPASRAKNNRAHVVHLAPLAREVLAGVPRLSGPPGDELVFASFRGPLGGFDRIKQRLDAAIAAEQGQPLAPWRLHDVRRSGVTFLAGAGIAPHVADRLLNHVGGTISGVAAVYQRNQFLPERRAALEAWARHLQACAAGIEITSNVLALR